MRCSRTANWAKNIYKNDYLISLLYMYLLTDFELKVISLCHVVFQTQQGRQRERIYNVTTRPVFRLCVPVPRNMPPGHTNVQFFRNGSILVIKKLKYLIIY